MSTREIAELTGKEHKHVLRDFRLVGAALDRDPERYAHFWTDPQNGQLYTEYLLPKDLTNTLVSGYSIPMRHAIVNRWMALEAQQASTHHIPSSYREAMLLAAEQQEYLAKKSEKVSDKCKRRIYPVAPLEAWSELVPQTTRCS